MTFRSKHGIRQAVAELVAEDGVRVGAAAGPFPHLHARSTAGWRNKVSWISLAGYACLRFNLIGVNILFSGLHSYAGI